MNKIEQMQVLAHEPLTTDVYKVILQGDLVSQITQPGQFLQIKIAGKYLRRPISISDYDKTNQTLTIIYKVLGEGTALLTALQVGEVLDCLGPLGNGFDVTAAEAATHIAICGGGVGIPPLYGLLKELQRVYPDKQITVVAGAKTASEMFYQAEFAALTETVYVTDDGSFNPPARNVVEALKALPAIDYIFTCGPNGMLQAIDANFETTPRQISLEEHMACGVGLCMGCVYPLGDGNYIRICKEGPVIEKPFPTKQSSHCHSEI